ncbi:MAG: DUF1848 family protein [Candidatus Methanoperedens sp.]|nr:MAG: DUF1848 family protein [Candidatus Methanoperedens sp.]
MPRIISVSRRTDIPAFYGDWFMNRLKDGFAGYVNPFGRQRYLVSLEPENVDCFVFWSKNFKPLMDKLKVINDMGYRYYFNYTITGLPGIFEGNSVNKEISIETLKDLGSTYSQKHINWRYDPIIISDITDYEFHIKNFEILASELEGHVERCIISFAMLYGKVKRNFEKFQAENGIRIIDPDTGFRINLARELADIAESHGIKMLSCCGDYMLSPKIEKAHCIDGKLIEELFYPGGFSHYEKPTRKECGCTYSVDIGTYDTCPHGCVYCYANLNKEIARARFGGHDKESVFLGYTKEDLDKWIKEVKRSDNKDSSLLDYS